MSTWVLLAAAGQGLRLDPSGATPKQFRDAGGIPLFWRSAEILNFVKTFFLPGRLEKLFRKRDAVMDEIIENATEHYSRLSDILAAHASGSEYGSPGPST